MTNVMISLNRGEVRVAYTSSREANTARAMRRVAKGGVLTDKRRAERAELAELREAARAEGQLLDERGFGEFCLICSRATDHWGEHSPEQIEAWRLGR